MYITGEELSLRDDNAMSNYFIGIEVFSNLGVILELNDHFQGSYGKLDLVDTETEFLTILKIN